jgi:ketosteroid isomerase-like protein
VSQENVERVRAGFDAWNRGDVDSFLETFHPECEYFSELIARMEGADNAVFRGRAGMRRFWEEWHSVWDLVVEVSEIRDLGDTVLTLGRTKHAERRAGSMWTCRWPTCVSSRTA